MAKVFWLKIKTESEPIHRAEKNRVSCSKCDRERCWGCDTFQGSHERDGSCYGSDLIPVMTELNDYRYLYYLSQSHRVSI